MGLFEEIEQSHTIFKDVNVLSPHYVPRELPFRERHINEITSILSPALKGQKPRNLIIYGKTGTGKTCSVKRIMEDFESSGKGRGAAIHYINCRIYNSRYRVMQKVLKNYIPEVEKSGFGLPYFYEKLIEIASSGKQIVLVLDEIDIVKDLNELVYTLTRSNDEIRNGGVTILGISNKLSFKETLDPRSRSSLYETEMVFAPYTAEQIQKILFARVDDGFIPQAVDSGAINLAAAITSQETGDARYALKLISKAGEIAQCDGRKRITDSDVEAARRKVEVDLTRETIATLPEMHQLVLYSIANLTLSGSKYSRLEGMENGLLFSGEVYEEYDNVCRKIGKRARSTRWYREYLSDLEILGLISTMPSGRGLRGQTTLIRCGSNPQDITEVLKSTLYS